MCTSVLILIAVIPIVLLERSKITQFYNFIRYQKWNFQITCCDGLSKIWWRATHSTYARKEECNVFFHFGPVFSELRTVELFFYSFLLPFSFLFCSFSNFNVESLVWNDNQLKPPSVSVVLWSRDVILLQLSLAITKIDNSHDYSQT